MRIATNCPITQNRTEITKKIAKFWNMGSDAWKDVLGIHIHHGYFNGYENTTSDEAQIVLMQNIINLIPEQNIESILDAGCGMGGASVFLEKHYHAAVRGITLSRRQMEIANEYARQHNAANIHFSIEDALEMQTIDNETFDLVWSLESCEQFYDKARFLKQAHRVLKKNGVLALATWCSGKDEYFGKDAEQYYKLCRAFDLPYMPSIGYYRSALKNSDFRLLNTADWSKKVAKSWDQGIALAKKYSILKLILRTGLKGFRFLRDIKLIQRAYRENRMCYGVFIAKKI